MLSVRLAQQAWSPQKGSGMRKEKSRKDIAQTFTPGMGIPAKDGVL